MTFTGSLVVDASALLAALLPEPHTSEATQRLADASDLYAPDLLIFETTAVLAARVSRGELAAEHAHIKRREACDFPVLLSPGRELSEQALALADRLDHSAYDCFYLALAIERECPLLTGDRALAAAARRQGLGDYVCLLGELLGSVEAATTSE